MTNIASSEFESHEQAANVLAQYWQGERPEGLEESIRGLGSAAVYKQARRFAFDATRDDEAARAVLVAADDFLWADYQVGSGVEKLAEY
jgi:hypothetical protein